MARDVGSYMAANDNDYTLPFRTIKPHLDQADIKFANLEYGITNSNETLKIVSPCATNPRDRCCDLRCFFKADPQTLSGVTEYANFNMLTIDNNHIDDYVGGRNDTIETLNKYNIPWVDWQNAYIVEDFKGCELNFFAWNTVDLVGGNTVVDERSEAVIEQIKNANPSAFKVAFIHGGIQYSHNSTALQEQLGQEAIDAGADIVVFCHAHVTENYGTYKGKHIFYGLGNFVFDQAFIANQSLAEDTRHFYMLKFDLVQCKNIENLQIIPGRINDYHQPILNETATIYP